MASKLAGKKIAIIATNGYEQSELQEPLKALKEAGAQCEIIAPQGGSIMGWKDKNWGSSLAVDKVFSEAEAHDYDALLIPGGALNCDTLRTVPEAVEFTYAFMKEHKPVAAICHGPQLLIEADSVEGRRLTSYPAIRTDLENAGAEWIDSEVVVDNGLVTSRSPKDLPSFIAKMIEEILEGQHPDKDEYSKHVF